MMQRPGAPADVLYVDDAPEPGLPGPHEALVELVAAAIHPSDLLTVMGMYASEPGPMPKALGKEGVGKVLAVGNLVKHLKPGDLTPILMGDDGVWQERHLLAAENLIALPPGGDPKQYALAIANPATALLMLRSLVPVKMGEWVIQNAANSSVGQCLIQIARRNGIRTVNVVRRDGLAAQLHDLGADVVLVDGPDLPKKVAAATGGSPVKLAIDAVAGEASARLAACLAPGGTLCTYGMMSGKNVQVSPAHLIGAGIVVRGFWLISEMARIGYAGRGALFAELFPLIVSGAVRSQVEATYPLAQAREALAHAARGERTGKILFTRD
ncbi:MAG: zinc-dependent alcohol dehydrogenase family protein [Acidobacteria bacterium]|nr:zinc-dependent alcohol dehydrogenase family protein [Acidobacteriota bacterium]